MPEPLRIVMADGSCPVREGARRRLLEDSDVVVAAAVGSAPDLLDAVERLRPAAVLTDIRMPASQRGLPEQALCRAVLAAAVIGCAGGAVSGGRLAARRRRR